MNLYGDNSNSSPSDPGEPGGASERAGKKKRPKKKPAAKKRKKPTRDLSKAVTLRPSELFLLYGFATSTTCELCKHPDPEVRMPSYFVPGRQGRKGKRFIDQAEFKVWFAKYRVTG